MGTIAERPEERLIEFLKEALDEDLRAVYRYDGEGRERLWPLDGPAPAPSEAAVLDRCIGAARQFDEGHGSTAGQADGLVGVVDDRTVVLLPSGEGGGFVVTADRRPDDPMTGFVAACLAVMR